MLTEKTISVLENNDIKIYPREKQFSEFYREIEFYSDAGEDCIETIWYNGTNEDFISAFTKHAEDFDPDEHAEIWVESRGKNGVPQTIRELLNDADDIKQFLLRVAHELNKSILEVNTNDTCLS